MGVCLCMSGYVHVALFGFHTQYGSFYRNIPELSKSSSECSSQQCRIRGQGSWEKAQVPQIYLAPHEQLCLGPRPSLLPSTEGQAFRPCSWHRLTHRAAREEKSGESKFQSSNAQQGELAPVTVNICSITYGSFKMK